MSGMPASLCIRTIHLLTSCDSFRQVPTFGRTTIRCFHKNVSGMKKLAARDYEDQLQACIPYR